MKLEELFNKEDRIEEDILEFYEVDNAEQLMQVVETRIRNNKERNIGYMYTGFEAIYEQSHNDGYNPIHEEVMFYTVVLAAYFGFEMGEVELFMDVIGIYEFIMEVDDILRDSDEVRFYKRMYNKYKEEQNSFRSLVMEAIKVGTGALADAFENLDEAKLQSFVKGAEERIQEFIASVGEQQKLD